jgi:hypothetical protein
MSAGDIFDLVGNILHTVGDSQRESNLASARKRVEALGKLVHWLRDRCEALTALAKEKGATDEEIRARVGDFIKAGAKARSSPRRLKLEKLSLEQREERLLQKRLLAKKKPPAAKPGPEPPPGGDGRETCGPS